MRRAFWILASIVLAGCNLDTPIAPDQPSDPATETFAPSLKIDLSAMTKTTAGTYYKDAKVGTGLTLNSHAVVVMSYVGFLKNGAPFTQAIGQLVDTGSLMPGLQDGMAGMKEGGERIIVIPSALGYGSLPAPGVPANSTLVFDVILQQLP